MANWLISRNRSILGAINVLSAYGKQLKSYRENILARSCTVSIQDGVQDGRRNMANWLISRNRSILGAINVLSTYGKQRKSYWKNILARSCTVSIQDGVVLGQFYFRW